MFKGTYTLITDPERPSVKTHHKAMMVADHVIRGTDDLKVNEQSIYIHMYIYMNVCVCIMAVWTLSGEHLLYGKKSLYFVKRLRLLTELV